MREKIIDGVAYECPMYVVRAADGWQVRMPGEKTVFFADLKCGGVKEAHAKAVAYRRDQLLITDQCRPLLGREIAGKKHKVGVAGIFLQTKQKKDRRTLEYHFAVKNIEGGTSTIYIGTESTWQRNYDRKLQRAKELREKVVEKLIVSG